MGGSDPHLPAQEEYAFIVATTRYRATLLIPPSSAKHLKPHRRSLNVYATAGSGPSRVLNHPRGRCIVRRLRENEQSTDIAEHALLADRATGVASGAISNYTSV